ncbi:MAG: hypothetical protein H0T47_17085 [Planctomycetaceae bacterium]|nr:hypothetical protein [Planctomycetaceae bacterium]
MSRLSFFFTTLIAAIPAAFLGYLCVMAFLLNSDKLPPILMGVAGITLLVCVAVIAMPAAVLLKGRATKAASDPKAGEPVVAETPSGEVAEIEEKPVVAAEDEDVFVEGDANEFDDFDETPKKK